MLVRAIALLAVVAAPASAASYLLTATAIYPAQSSDFTVGFDDLDGDLTLSLDEVTSFSGFTSVQFSQTYPELLRVPVISGIADGEVFVSSSGNLTSNSWLFADGAAHRTAPNATSFTYGLSPAVVPLPASGFLLLAALGGLLMTRRRH